MKIICSLLAATLLCMKAHASVTIMGNVESDAGKTIALCKSENGYSMTLASACVAPNVTFTLETDIQNEGYYMLTNETGVKHALYLTPLAKVTADFSNTMLKVNSGYNTAAALFPKWEEAVGMPLLHAYRHTMVPGASTADAETFNSELSNMEFMANKIAGNEITGKAGLLLKLKARADLSFVKMAYGLSNAGQWCDSLTLVSIFRQAEQLFLDDNFLSLPYAPDMLSVYINGMAYFKHIDKDDYVGRAALLATPRLREAYLWHTAQQLRYYEQLSSLVDAVDPSTLSGDFSVHILSVEQKLQWSKPGKNATTFSGVTPEGTTVSLDDFKGKVVVIDTWATWCVPCIKMMPHFKRLAKELSNPNVVFLSVCLGTSVEIDRWKDIVKKHQLEGNLIFISSWTKGFANDYRITSVPRFIVISREGKVASFAAPAPNTPQLKRLIMSLI